MTTKFEDLMAKYALTDADAYDAPHRATKYHSRNRTKKGPGRKHDNKPSARSLREVELGTGVIGNKLAHRAKRGTSTLQGAS